MECAGICREDLCWGLSSRRPFRRRVCVLCFQTPQRVGSVDPIFLRATVGGAWPPPSTRGVLLQPLGGHRHLPPRNVRGGDAPSRFFLQHSGGRVITSLMKVGSGLSHGSIPRAPQFFGVGSEPCCGSISLALTVLVSPPMLPTTAKRDAAVHPPYGRRSHRAQVCRIRGVPCAAGRTALMPPRGVVQDVVRRGGGGRVLGWSCPHPCRGTGARTSSHVPRWSSTLANRRGGGGRCRLCRGGRCRRC
jgi:hypothetical protein